MQNPSPVRALVTLAALTLCSPWLASCASDGSGRLPPYPDFSPGFSTYSPAPWGYRSIYIGPREVYPDWALEPDRAVEPDMALEPDRSVEPGQELDLGLESDLGGEPDLGIETGAETPPLPDLGMPDFGGTDFDFGGFD